MFQETSEGVQVTEWTDRVYRNTQPEHIVTNVVSGRKMRVLKYNLADTGKESCFSRKKVLSLHRRRNFHLTGLPSKVGADIVFIFFFVC